MDISKKIKSLRALNNLTLLEVAEYTGVSKGTVSRWETGKIKNLKLDKISKLSRVLKTTPAYLMGLEDKSGEYIPLNPDENVSGISKQTGEYIEQLPPEAIEELDKYVKLLAQAYLNK